MVWRGGGRYVYVVKGLWLEPGSAEWVPPCTAHHVSRWVRVAASGGCSGDVLSGGTANVVQSAIPAHDGGVAEGTNYTDGLAANKNGGACDPWFGPLAEAEARCTNDPSCRYLQDDDGSAVNWRLCSSVAFDPDGIAAVKVKPARYWGANPTIRDVVVADYTASEPFPHNPHHLHGPFSHVVVCSCSKMRFARAPPSTHTISFKSTPVMHLQVCTSDRVSECSHGHFVGKGTNVE
jgi:hypothetical protein